MYGGTLGKGGANLMAITDRNLSVGTQLHAKYKGVTYRAEVVLNPNATGDRPIAYRVEGKDELFKSPSAAGTAITEKACNGWAFWTVGDPPIATEVGPANETPKPAKARGTKKAAAGSEQAAPPT